MTDTDVVVVGGGPVGLTLAILLAQAGHRVTILERQPQAYPLPRAVHCDHEVARIFQAAGIGTELAQVSEPADVYEWRNGEGTTLLRLGRVGEGGSGWPFSLMFHQPSLEAALERRAEHVGVEIRRGEEVTGVTEQGDTVLVSDARQRHRGAVRGGLRRRQQHRARAAPAPGGGARLLLRLADRRRPPARGANLRSAERAGVRPGPPDDGRVRRSRAKAMGVHATRGRGTRRHRGARVGSPRTVGRASRQRDAGAPSGVHVRGSLRGELAPRARAPGR